MANQKNSKKKSNQDNKNADTVKKLNQKKGTEVASAPDQPLADMNE